MAQTFSPTDTYGSNAVKNRVRPGGTLGSNQYYYTTNALTGEVTVNRYVINRRGRNTQDVEVGTIPQGGVFTPNSTASNAEKTHYGSSSELGKARAQALKVARREWNGRTSPPPNQAIYGTNAINAAYGAKNSKGEVFAGTRPEEGGAAIPEEEEMQRQARLNRLAANKGTGGVFDNASMAQKGSNTSLGAGEVVIYPQTLRSIGGGKGQDYIKLQMLKYSPKKFGEFTATNISGVGERKKNRQGLGSVILPIPGGISDNNNVAWGGDTMNPAAMALASAAYATIIDGAKAGGEQAGRILDSARANAGKVKGALGAAIAGAASKTGATTIKRVSGSIINPNMELLFNNPSLRQFNFSWKLAPRSREEAQAVIKIIRFFKQGMAPVREEPNLFLKAPNTWKITYTHLSEQHRYLNRFKECAMVNCGVQYTPDGNYATYEDGVMTAYQLTLAFQELDPVYSDDYKDIPNTEIGF